MNSIAIHDQNPYTAIPTLQNFQFQHNHNLAFPPSLSVTAALLKAGLPVSLTLVADVSALFVHTQSARHTKDDLVSFLPHFRNQSLTWNDYSRKSDFDVFVLSKCFQDMFTGDTHETKAMEDCL